MSATIDTMSRWTFDDAGFGPEARPLPWHELVAVGIRTTADGPFSEDVFWQFLVPSGVLELPGSRFDAFEALGTRLPGFDWQKTIDATGSCEERIFRVWHREESPGRPDEAALRVRFARLVGRLGGGAPTDAAFARLYGAWSASARRYHDAEHLADCLREVDRVAPSPTRDVVELALWYHDAVYEPGASDNEERSAAWLLSDAAALGISEERASEAAALVRTTAHGAAGAGAGAGAASEGAALIADIDLAILGRDPLRFMEFEYGVAEEFAAVPKIAFRRGRRRFLERLVAKPIYRTAVFRERFEAAAQANVRALLASPRYQRSRWLRWLTR